ncbi:cyclopropane-fatty-acyl-phospholipid synthase isoform X2 [Folsomia candida]|nr:cyclopropane-fatty-acyl-phospholipid synthase isoform X2 [Folsomia candida]
MDGFWDAEDIVELTCRTMKNGIYRIYMNPWNRFLNFLECYFFNLQSKEQCWEVGQKHYDTGNDLFESFLDPSMNYSCGYWKSAKNLTEAQIAKMELIAQKLSLKPGMTVLDIGCGWGGLCYHLAKNYGVSVVGITISKEQAALAQQRCEGLPVEIRLVDYRDLKEKFDRIVSVGMFEHVGHSNYREFFETSHRCLKDDGIFLLHSIGVNHKDIPCAEPWFHYYIFPNGILPYYKHITDCSEGLFIIEDWQNMGNDYSRTLLAWLENFKKNWPTIEAKYGPRFYRMWNYYLQFSAGSFRSRKFQLWQVVLSKDGIQGGYYAAR